MVGVEAMVAEEAYEGDIELSCDLDGEAGGSAYGGYHRHAAHQGLLQEFKTGAAREHQHRVPQRKTIAKELGADELIHCVMTADVFAKNDQAALGIEQGGSVQAASAIEDKLCLSQTSGESVHNLGGDSEPIWRAWGARGLQRHQ